MTTGQLGPAFYMSPTRRGTRRQSSCTYRSAAVAVHASLASRMTGHYSRAGGLAPHSPFPRSRSARSYERTYALWKPKGGRQGRNIGRTGTRSGWARSGRSSADWAWIRRIGITSKRFNAGKRCVEEADEADDAKIPAGTTTGCSAYQLTRCKERCKKRS
jgi:hypothetical protein